MASVRRRLRSCAMAWLVFQVAWIAALVPRDCCAAHRPAPDTTCHESASQTAAQHQPPAPSPPAECRLTGGCDGPMGALVTLFSNHGILPASPAALPQLDVRAAWTGIPQNIIGRLEPPDLPPPRA